MLENARVVTFTVSELLRDNQQGLPLHSSGILSPLHILLTRLGLSMIFYYEK